MLHNIIYLKDLKLAVRKKTQDLGLLFKKINYNCTLVINGQLLKHAFSDDLKMDFLKLCVNCKSVIVCRISATQKAEVPNKFIIQLVQLLTRFEIPIQTFKRTPYLNLSHFSTMRLIGIQLILL